MKLQKITYEQAKEKWYSIIAGASKDEADILIIDRMNGWNAAVEDYEAMKSKKPKRDKSHRIDRINERLTEVENLVSKLNAWMFSIEGHTDNHSKDLTAINVILKDMESELAANLSALQQLGTVVG